MEETATASSASSSTSAITATNSFRLRSSPSLNSVRLRRIFDMFDKNGDGTITADDLSQALSLLGLHADLADLESTLHSRVRPGNSGLNFQDFSALHATLDDALFGGGGPTEAAERERREESDLREAFRVFDEDGDGYISAQELQVVLRKLGFSEAGEIDRVRQMILSVDLNHDGLVDFFEFKDMMRRVLVN